MTPERWRQVSDAFALARAAPPELRDALVRTVCGGDDELLREIETLLVAAGDDGFLVEPAFGSSTAAILAEAVRPSTPDEAICGDLLGAIVGNQYDVLEIVGRGGSGVVYRARQRALDRDVAIKVLRPAAVERTGALERFEREALAVARLKHPNIVTIHDLGVSPGLGAYIVMELLSGRSLRAELDERGAFPEPYVIELAAQLCSALGAAHAAGIVHRDLKPDNIVLELGPRGEVTAKLLDFGIAKLDSASDPGRPWQTLGGMLVGTPAYMSPEQCQGRPLDARADLYSLGCVLYEALTGRPPFSGDNVAALVRDHVSTSPVSPRDLVAGLSRSTEAAVLRALAKRPDDRFDSADALCDALRGSGDRGRRFVDERLRREGLPRAATRFVGREGELEDLAALLERARLVTLTGPGGIGKTRLAVETARAAVALSKAEAWFVDLAAVAEASFVLKAVAAALGVSDKASRPIADLVVERLSTGSPLLVLDNCEHLVEACADLAARLLDGPGTLRLIATSREPLGVSGEIVWPVPALPVPDSDDELSAARLIDHAATALFVDRVAFGRPDFVPTDRDARTISSLCRRLDGIPLGIELAAARARVLSVDQILDRLDDRFRLLTSGCRTAPRRQQTLRAAMDWSYDLLEDDERALLRCLSVFVGGWGIEAAEAIGAGSGERSVLEGLARLVDKSFVLVDDRAGEARYRMLDTIRLYAVEKASAAGESFELLERHTSWFLEWAERAELELSGPEQIAWLDRLDADHENLRAVLRRAVDGGGANDAGIRMCAALGRFWFRRGHLNEGLEWTKSALARTESRPTVALGGALYACGLLEHFTGDYVAALTALGKAEAVQRGIGDERGLARTLYTRSASTLVVGDVDAATAIAEECLELSRRTGNRQMLAMADSTLGRIAFRRGELDRARSHFERSLAICRELGDVRDVCLMAFNLGEVAVDAADLPVAERYLSEASELSIRLGDKTMHAGTCAGLGNVALKRGEVDRARSLYRRALALCHELHLRLDAANVMDGLAQAAAAAGEAEMSLRLSGAAGQLRDELSGTLTAEERAEHERCLRSAYEALSAEQARRAMAEGRAMGYERAIEYATGGE